MVQCSLKGSGCCEGEGGMGRREVVLYSCRSSASLMVVHIPLPAGICPGERYIHFVAVTALPRV